MNSRFTLALGAVVVGACTTMAMQDGGLARADDPPAAASKAEVLALKNQVTQDIAALYYRVEQLEADRDELQATVAELEARSPGLGAYDAEGNWLGTVLEYQPGDEIGSVKSALVWHPALKRAFYPPSTGAQTNLVYTQPDCAGKAYLPDSADVRVGAFDAPAGLLWIPVGPKKTITQMSGGLGGQCSNYDPTERLAYDVESIVPPFPLPVSWPISVH